MADAAPPTRDTRGRPRKKGDVEILEAALYAFSSHGFDAMSLRALNRQLGLSHGTINQRFESKQKLFYAAVDHGFGGLAADMAARAEESPMTDSAASIVRSSIRSFLIGSARRPELVRLMNLEGQEDTDRLDYIWTAHVEPLFGPVYDQIREMGRDENLQPVSARAMFFIVTHGAAAPYTLDALSRRFDTIDGPLAAEVHAELLTEMIMTSLLAGDQT
jgi:AcrR family transcriptional regulator